MSRRHAGVTGRTTVTHPSTNRVRRRATSSMRLPASLSSLRDLAVLDVSHNRLEAVPPALADLAARLYRCVVVLFLLHGFPGLSTDTSDHISVFYFSVFFLFSFFNSGRFRRHPQNRKYITYPSVT